MIEFKATLMESLKEKLTKTTRTRYCPNHATHEAPLQCHYCKEYFCDWCARFCGTCDWNDEEYYWCESCEKATDSVFWDYCTH